MSPKPTYANIVSTLALVVALSGTGAYAAGLAKNSVKSKHIKDGQVKVVDLANGSVTAAKLAPGAVPDASIPDGSVTGAKISSDAITGAKVADNSLKGADIDESSLGTVGLATRSLTVLAAAVKFDGTLAAGQGYNTASVQKVGIGGYRVAFNRDVSTCSYVASTGLTGSQDSLYSGTATTSHSAANPNAVFVGTYDGDGVNSNRSFFLIVVC